MQLTVKTLLTASALAILPLAGLAQSETASEAPAETASEAPAETETPETESTGTGTVPGTGLSTGVPAQDERIGQTYVKSSHGDWQLRCIRTQDGNDPCQLYQLLIDGEDNAVAEINLFPVEGNQNIVAGATIVTPLETLLTANLRLAVDGGEGRVYPFSFCRTIGCFARLGFGEAEVAQFRRGAVARVIIVPAAAPDQTVELKASLTGFTAGFKALLAEGQ